MADPLSISASVAGLITVADIVIRNGHKYIKAVKNADKTVVSLMREVNLLSGTLHSLRNVAEGLEDEAESFRFTTKVHHVEYCYQTLRKINLLLENFELSKSKGVLHSAAQRLRWPLSVSETKELMAEVERHRTILGLALQADEMSALLTLLAKEEAIGAVVSDIHRGLDRDRVHRNMLAMSRSVPQLYQKTFTHENQDEQRRKMLEWLCPATLDPTRNHESSISLCQPGSGTWFTEGVEFQEWRLKKSSKLWLYGIPGAGKTILMSTIIQELEKDIGKDEGKMLLIDYLAHLQSLFSFTNAETQEISKILGSLVKQFMVQDETEVAFEALRVCYHSHQDPSPRLPKPEKLLELLHAVVRPFSVAAVIIDGIDEISSNRLEATELLRCINQPHGSIRTLFASRCEIDIEECLDDYERVSIAARSSDLELYVASEIEIRTKRKQLNIKDPDLKAQIMKRLINGADGMFRWVACQLDHLCELGTDRARRTALDKLPRGLPKTYERILERVLETHEETQDLVKRALQWLAVAPTLSGRALLEALALRPGDSRLDPEAMTSEEDILKWCSSFVRRRANGNGLELAHFTVKEYLMCIDSANNPRVGKFRISESESNLLIGKICLTYLTLDTFAETPLPANLLGIMYSNIKEDTILSLSARRESAEKEPQSQRSTHDTPDTLSLSCLESYPLLVDAAASWTNYCKDHLMDTVIASLSHKLFHPRKSNQFLWWSYAFLSNWKGCKWAQTFPDTTTLHWAAMLGLEEVCGWLIREGSDVNRGSSLGTPLDCLLLGLDATWRCYDLKDIKHNDSMHKEGKDTKGSIAHLFIEAGSKLNDNSNSTSSWLPLQLALKTERHNNYLIALLLQAGSKVDLCTLQIVEECVKRRRRCDIPCGYLALIEEVSADQVQEDARDTFLILSEKLKANKIQMPQLHEISTVAEVPATVDVTQLEECLIQTAEYGQAGDARALITVLKDRLPPMDSNKILSRGLRHAAQNGQERIVTDLLESGASANIVDDNRDSALHHSLFEDKTFDVDVVIRIVQALLLHGADPSLRNKEGELVFHLAVKSKKKGLFKALVEAAGMQSTQIILASSHPSVLQHAIEWGLDDTVSYLLEIYTDIDENNHRSETGKTLLGKAARRETPIALRQLLSRGLDIKALDADGSSALYNAVIVTSHGENFNVLMEAGGMDGSSRKDGRRAIHAAAEMASSVADSMLEALLVAGENPNATTKKGHTPLHLLAFRFPYSTSKIKLLAGRPRLNINCRDHKGRTPLMLCLDVLAAAFNRESMGWINQQEVLEILDGINVFVDHSRDVNLVDNSGATALHHICSGIPQQVSFNVIKTLINRGSSLHHRNSAGVTPFEALLYSSMTRLGNANGKRTTTTLSGTEVLRFIITRMPGHHLNDHLSNGSSPLAVALELKCAEAVELLLSREDMDVDVDARSQDLNQISPLEVAAVVGCNETVARKLICRISRPVDSFSPVKDGSILHFAACEKDSPTFLKVLLKDNTNLDLETPDKCGRTPLQLSIMNGCLGAISLLLEAGADANKSSPDGTNYPLLLAVHSGSIPIVNALIQYKAELDVRGYRENTPLIAAASKGFDQIIRRLVEAGADIARCCDDGAPALFVAALNQHWGTVKLLVDLGADVNYVCSRTKDTILHIASERGTWETVEFLLRKATDLGAFDLNGKTPFLRSASAGQWDIVAGYLEYGTDANAKSLLGWTAMHCAIHAGAKDIVELLCKHGAPLLQDARNQHGTLLGNSLTCAAGSGDANIFDMILKEGPGLGFVNDEGYKLTHYAVGAKDDAVRELLFAHNIDWDANTAEYHEGRINFVEACPLHIAACWGNDNSINFLKFKELVQNIDARTGEPHCYTPLHIAAHSNHLSTVKLLLDFGADVDLVDRLAEKTALHYAAELGFVDIVRVLLDHGCHPNLPDARGMTPELLAVEKGHVEVSAMLSRHLDGLEEAQQAEARMPTVATAEAKSTLKAASACATAPKNVLWRLPLTLGPNFRRIMTNDVSIYAIDNTTCPPALRALLEQHEGKEVDKLGTPYRRRIAWKKPSK
ncbi:hypothetical protein EPUS_01684 [Endocarpon pusillum Z07020]|uniref:Nephrocystin 3-like N-terminal domain-containing protein n=1 Tax=Endocarpon pusillum (strain Z07020 / HMAS-L-300199) TaxID=1263415 RepID=U1HRK6_ENDPU|nr:uncharacterized protein EPUS_01684 [Endocarpon pusillum Z07020]ERF71769.1 hypothetical protein EPUS_01684 [Endocarpon pusillum Z07020]